MEGASQTIDSGTPLQTLQWRVKDRATRQRRKTIFPTSIGLCDACADMATRQSAEADALLRVLAVFPLSAPEAAKLMGQLRLAQGGVHRLGGEVTN